MLEIRQFVPDMAEWRDGSIVVMSSIAAMRASAVLSGYGAAKAGLNALVRSIAVEFGASNVRANAIAPAVVRTGFSQDLWRHPERERALVARIPAKRLADPEDIVGTAILLASPAGSYISGQVLVVDGGWTIS